MLSEIITSPLFLFLQHVLPEGFGAQVLNFFMAWVLLKFTVAKHFQKIEEKFDTLTNTIDNGFTTGDQRMTALETQMEKMKTLPLRVEILEDALNKTQGG